MYVAGEKQEYSKERDCTRYPLAFGLVEVELYEHTQADCKDSCDLALGEEEPCHTMSGVFYSQCLANNSDLIVQYSDVLRHGFGTCIHVYRMT